MSSIIQDWQNIIDEQKLYNKLFEEKDYIGIKKLERKMEIDLYGIPISQRPTRFELMEII